MDLNLLDNFFRNDNLLETNMLNLVPSAVYVCDTKGVIRQFNTQGGLLLGREPRTGIDTWHDFLDLQPGDNADPGAGSYSMNTALKDGRPFTGDIIVARHTNGSQKHIVPSSTPIFDKTGALMGVVNALADISEAWQKEKAGADASAIMEQKISERTADLLLKNEQLSKSEERYHKMIDEVKDYAILLLDKDGTVLNWNQGAERIKGYKEEEVVGRNFRIFYLEDDRNSGLPEKLINRAATEGRAIHEGERLRKDGTRFWGSITITALHDDDGGVIGFSKVTRDLTDKKIAEDRIRQYMAELEFQNKELEQFAYAAAHDMREPLRKILYYNNHLQDTVIDLLDSKSQEYLKRSVNAATRMQRLIDDLLAYSKTTINSDEPELVSLDNVLQDTLSSLHDTLRQQNAKVHVVPLPVVTGSAVQLQQLFDNLFANSIKYRSKTEDPHIRISHKIVKGSVHNELEPQKKYHSIDITDNGIGFGAEEADEIFNLFHRLHSGAEYPGTGIGLAICKKIMQNHHGVITAAGKPGQGATFTLFFPVHG